MAIVRPELVAQYSMGNLKHGLHIALSAFCFINVIGNMIMVIITDTTVKRGSLDGVYCDICKIRRPFDAWHCKLCNVCIERRDHHCLFLHRCIGLNNQRYYLLYLFYLTVSMIYSMYYNYLFTNSKFDGYGLLLSISRLLNPMVRILLKSYCVGTEDLCALFFMINIGVFLWSTALLHFHLKNVIRGLTWHDALLRKKFYEGTKLSHEMWQENLMSVFGTRWHWAVLWPFVESPPHGRFKTCLKIA
ncbi:probable palmitoyltransferase ZDHHC24 [Amyelois transitella]|uniref:probable palmitoyltransferase ZDHHC24 n=1 Tax=Amyelois transitella TaxID=680683 RepID=UPI00298F5060|nr:probable palmitoyltransferase ZDHHC24 [Amyelois transitella]